MSDLTMFQFEQGESEGFDAEIDQLIDWLEPPIRKSVEATFSLLINTLMLRARLQGRLLKSLMIRRADQLDMWIEERARQHPLVSRSPTRAAATSQ